MGKTSTDNENKNMNDSHKMSSANMLQVANREDVGGIYKFGTQHI